MARTWVVRHQLVVFFLLAYVISWTAQLPGYLFARREGVTLSNEANTAHFLDLAGGELHPGLAPYLFLFSFAFGPTLAGVVVTGLVGGREGLRDLWRRVTTVRVAPRWVVIVLLLPVALALVSLAVAFLANGARPVGFDPLLPLGAFVPLLLYMLICTGLAEEVGWRGYALPELQRRHSAERASWLLGIGWGLWHIPSVLVGPYLLGNVHLGLVVPILLGLTLGIVGWTIVITWIYNNTQSVFWVIVLHGWFNIVQSYLILSAEHPAAQAVFPLLPWVVAIVLLRRYGARTLTARPVRDGSMQPA
ncbi:CPBP family intramembrane glutamic endopeptidase [Ornithinimicrobium cerasi]|uniref:CPBP family intramembrane glutamic endopeptidase n=1 Tax=Ornithinimicrobium cerasi TaxID=2248773 RepID=UPI000EFE2FE5|nr:CPBP family intramembrane glutamic endopeptidase [Ornithinimicrobium cerasi]